MQSHPCLIFWHQYTRHLHYHCCCREEVIVISYKDNLNVEEEKKDNGEQNKEGYNSEHDDAWCMHILDQWSRTNNNPSLMSLSSK